MKLEKQVCTLKRAQKLKELGVSLKANFFWVSTSDYNDYILIDADEFLDLIMRYEDGEIQKFDAVAALTVAELGVLLPIEIENESDPDDNYFLKIYNFGQNSVILANNGWQIVYVSNDGLLVSINGETEAEARAEALIFLLENGFLKTEDLKL